MAFAGAEDAFASVGFVCEKAGTASRANKRQVIRKIFICNPVWYLKALSKQEHNSKCGRSKSGKVRQRGIYRVS
jgi:hypothetical protein